jgi:hypothetical protein
LEMSTLIAFFQQNCSFFVEEITARRGFSQGPKNRVSGCEPS